MAIIGYKDTTTGDFIPVKTKTIDTLPVGAEVDYDGETVPDGWSAISGTQVTKYSFGANVSGTTCQSGWVDTLQKSYSFTGLLPNKNYIIIWTCSWVRNNETESSASSGECKWKTNNGGFTNGVMTAPAGVNQTFNCFGYDTSNSSGSLTVNLYSNSGGAWASKTPYFSALSVMVFAI